MVMIEESVFISTSTEGRSSLLPHISTMEREGSAAHRTVPRI